MIEPCRRTYFPPFPHPTPSLVREKLPPQAGKDAENSLFTVASTALAFSGPEKAERLLKLLKTPFDSTCEISLGEKKFSFRICGLYAGFALPRLFREHLDISSEDALLSSSKEIAEEFCSEIKKQLSQESKKKLSLRLVYAINAILSRIDFGFNTKIIQNLYKDACANTERVNEDTSFIYYCLLVNDCTKQVLYGFTIEQFLSHVTGTVGYHLFRPATSSEERIDCLDLSDFQGFCKDLIQLFGNRRSELKGEDLHDCLVRCFGEEKKFPLANYGYCRKKPPTLGGISFRYVWEKTTREDPRAPALKQLL